MQTASNHFDEVILFAHGDCYVVCLSYETGWTVFEDEDKVVHTVKSDDVKLVYLVVAEATAKRSEGGNDDMYVVEVVQRSVADGSKEGQQLDCAID